MLRWAGERCAGYGQSHLPDAGNHLATFITGEFCMIACDDDLWAPNFLSVLVKYLQLHPDVGLAFPNACYVDVEGNRGTQRLLSKRSLYARGDSRWPMCGAISGSVGLFRRSSAFTGAMRTWQPCPSTRSTKRSPMWTTCFSSSSWHRPRFTR